jgi:hypothetical protein
MYHCGSQKCSQILDILGQEVSILLKRYAWLDLYSVTERSSGHRNKP